MYTLHTRKEANENLEWLFSDTYLTDKKYPYYIFDFDFIIWECNRIVPLIEYTQTPQNNK